MIENHMDFVAHHRKSAGDLIFSNEFRFPKDQLALN
jgi:hypothetical protein